MSRRLFPIVMGLLIALFFALMIWGAFTAFAVKDQFCQDKGWQEHIYLQNNKVANYCHTEGKLSQPFICSTDLARQRCFFVEELP